MKQTVGKSSTIWSYQSELIVFKYGLGYTTLKIVIHKNIITVITLQNSSKNTVSNEMHWISQNVFFREISWRQLVKFFIKTLSSPKWLILCVWTCIVMIFFFTRSLMNVVVCSILKKNVKSLKRIFFFFVKSILIYHLAGFVFQFRKLSFRLG